MVKDWSWGVLSSTLGRRTMILANARLSNQKIPWTGEPGRLQSMGSLRIGHDWVTALSLFHFHALEKDMATHSSVLAWRIPGKGKPGGLPCMGSHRVGHDWSDLAAAARPVKMVMRWMKLEPIIQSEVSRKEKHQYSILTHIYVI